MGNLVVKSIKVNKVKNIRNYRRDFMVYDIMTALQDMQEDATIIRIEDYEGTQEEKSDLIINLCDTYDSAPGSFVICVNTYISTTEFPPEKYYDPIFSNPEEKIKGKKPVPIEEILDREHKLFFELGFISINAVVKYNYRDAMIYTNDIGRRLIDHWLGETINRKRG